MKMSLRFWTKKEDPYFILFTILYFYICIKIIEPKFVKIEHDFEGQYIIHVHGDVKCSVGIILCNQSYVFIFMLSFILTCLRTIYRGNLSFEIHCPISII